MTAASLAAGLQLVARAPGRRLWVWAAAGCVIACLVALAIGLDVAVVLAAEPEASAVALVPSGDPRSDGAGPGIVGSPLAILVGVIALGLSTVLVTIVLARLARRD